MGVLRRNPEQTPAEWELERAASRVKNADQSLDEAKAELERARVFHSEALANHRYWTRIVELERA